MQTPATALIMLGFRGAIGLSEPGSPPLVTSNRLVSFSSRAVQTLAQETIMSEAVLTEASDGVLTITINRPEAKNAVNGAVAKGIAAAIDELDNNSELVVGILKGAGGTFCSGMDLAERLEKPDHAVTADHQAVEASARANLGMIKPGETFYLVSPEEP